MNKLLPLLLMLLLPLAGCRHTSDANSERPMLTVTITPLGAIVGAIAGERFGISVLVPPGAGPETYSATPRQLIEMNRSKALFRIGTLGLEHTRVKNMAEAAPDLPMTDVAQGIRPTADTGNDPHVWTSPANIKHMARIVHATLCRIDPEAKEYYDHRLARFEHHADSIDTTIRRRLQNVTARTFLIAHPTLGSFADAYGLRQLCVEQDGKEPSPERIARLVEQCRAEDVRVVFVQKEHPSRAARRIARETGARVVEINPLSDRWEDELLHIADALTR